MKNIYALRSGADVQPEIRSRPASNALSPCVGASPLATRLGDGYSRPDDFNHRRQTHFSDSLRCLTLW
jgi:hypothetical protein